MEDELGSSGSGTATSLNSSNIGFQLLKKHGWKEGTGLGISQQPCNTKEVWGKLRGLCNYVHQIKGILEPVEAYVKNNKRGLGADKVKKKALKPHDDHASKGKNGQEHVPPKKTKALSKRMRKLQEVEMKMQEKEFERAFFREFWPENV